MKSPLIIIVVLLLFISHVGAFGRITQGSTVYLDEVYDISSVTGWDSSGSQYLAWYGGFSPDAGVSPFLLELPPKRLVGEPSQYRYLIGSSVFGSRLGEWHQYYPAFSNVTERHGNTLAFIVEKTRPIVLTATNVTGVVSYVVGGNDTVIVVPDKILPEVRVADYLLARGDDFGIPVYSTTNAWLFGRVDKLYNYRSVNSSVELRKDLISVMEPGDYTLILQTPTLEPDYFMVRFNEEPNTIEWFDTSSFTVRKIQADGFSPRVFLEKMREIIPNSRDSFQEYNLTIQDPAVSIVSVDERYAGGISILDVRGYTNTNPGTTISLILDEERQIYPHEIAAHTYTGVAKGEFNGYMRYYQIYVPIAWDDMAPGMHTIKATTDIGGEMYYDFPIFEMPADSYRPNATLKYINDRNPWVPTPTPEVRVTTVIQKVVVTQTVLVNVTPSKQQLDDAASAALGSLVTTALIWCGMIAGILIIAGYGLHVWKKGQRFKKRGLS
jgi:hypothetical protein